MKNGVSHYWDWEKSGVSWPDKLCENLNVILTVASIVKRRTLHPLVFFHFFFLPLHSHTPCNIDTLIHIHCWMKKRRKKNIQTRKECLLFLHPWHTCYNIYTVSSFCLFTPSSFFPYSSPPSTLVDKCPLLQTTPDIFFPLFLRYTFISIPKIKKKKILFLKLNSLKY